MDLKKSLENIVGEENVSDDDFEVVCYARGWTPDIPRVPQIIVRPRNAEQISSILRLANRMKVPVVTLGGQSNLIGHPEGVVVLDMTAMNRLVEIDEISMTATGQAGMTWSALLYELSKKGWETGPYLHSAATATLGGSVALCANGWSSGFYGLVGEQVVALEVVLPNGEIVRTGSAANPAARRFIRYCYGSDLTGLFIGSHGIFGVITEVTLKIYPKAEARAYYAYYFKTIENACKALYEIQKTRVPMEGPYIVMYTEGPYEAALRPIVVFGTKDEVELYGKVVQEICLKEGGVPFPKDEMEQIANTWVGRLDRLKDIPPSGADQPLMPVNYCSNIPTLDYPEIVKAFWKVIKEEQIEKYRVWPKMGGFACLKNVVASPATPYDERDRETWMKIRELMPKIMKVLVDKGLAPHYTGRLKGPPEVMWKLGSYMVLMRTIKKALDPNNILNPGYLNMQEF